MSGYNNTLNTETNKTIKDEENTIIQNRKIQFQQHI